MIDVEEKLRKNTLEFIRMQGIKTGKLMNISTRQLFLRLLFIRPPMLL